jgi:hypothetical protein
MFMNRKFSEETLPVTVLAAAASSLTGNTTAVNMQDYRKVAFLINRGADSAQTFTTTITVQACNTAAGGSATAIPFYYRSYEQSGTSADLPTTNPTLATSSGFTTSTAATTTSTATYIVEVDEQALWNVSGDQDLGTYKYVRVSLSTQAGSAPIGSVVAIMANPKFQGTAVARTVLA